MAQKRMFDKAIIDTDKFMDMPLSAKALYFLLGMEADDEGFVSYKKVMRIHGGNDDDIKVLIAKCLIIMFESRVVVITDWKKNNWLDSRRIKPTEYTAERELLALDKDNSYLLSNGLARVEESSIEENSIEEKRNPTEDFFTLKDNSALDDFKGKFDEQLLKSEVQRFILYWTEKSPNGKKQKWEMQKTFDVKRRLVTWFDNKQKWNKEKKQVKTIIGLEKFI